MPARRARTRTWTALRAWAVSLALATSALAQGAEEAGGTTPPADVVLAQAERGWEALTAGRAREAVAFLGAATAANPTLAVGVPARSVAFLLGRTLDEAGQREAAREAWRRGVTSSLEQGALDVHAADAFVRATFAGGHEAEYGTGAEVYLRILERWGTRLGPDEEALVRRHVERALLPLPSEQREALRAQTHPGQALAAWWRRQDPLPATDRNERLVEHLERIAHAESTYADPSTPTGLDVRGEVYVRLGEPARRRPIDYFTPELVRRIQALREASGNNLLVSPSSFAPAEIWYYHGREPYHYLFVREGRRVRIGEVTDLVPQHLRSAIDRTGRGAAKADVLLEVFRTVYEQLAPYDLNYVQRLYDVSTYLGQMEELVTQQGHEVAEQGLIAAHRRADYAAALQRGGGPVGARTPDVMARNLLETARREDHLLARQREERAPPARSAVLDGIEPFGVAARVVRFLERDGTTRAEILWAPLPGAIPLGTDLVRAAREAGYGGWADLVVRTSLVRRPGHEDRRTEEIHLHTIPAATVAAEEPLAPQTLVAAGLRPGDELAVQWDVHLARLEGREPRMGPRARVAVLRTEALELLHGDGRLEMSDLKPVLGPTHVPVPFERVRTDQPLALYFEGYGLTFGADDQVHFAVEYEVTLRREGGLLRRTREETTAGNLLSTIRGTRTEQYLILNPGAWAGASEVEVVVTLRDESTGEEVARRVRFGIED